MTTTYCEHPSYALAKHAALNLSRQSIYKNTPVYANWIEDNAWSVDLVGELGNTQDYAYNGKWVNVYESEYYD